MIADVEFNRLVSEAMTASFSGWDFSWLESRIVEEVETKNNWDYDERAHRYMQFATSVLDHGTGGGERLSQLGPFPSLSVATESYLPNVAIAAHRLQPLGIEVVCVHEDCHDVRGPQPDGSNNKRRLSFGNDSFELVLAHNSSFCPAEVYRILCPGGILLTGQNGPSIPPTLADLLEGTIPEWEQEGHRWDMDASLDAAGFECIEKLEAITKTTYLDIGAVVYHLRAVPWIITDFEIERYKERLYRLHLYIKEHNGFSVRKQIRLLEMVKPSYSSEKSIES